MKILTLKKLHPSCHYQEKNYGELYIYGIEIAAKSTMRQLNYVNKQHSSDGCKKRYHNKMHLASVEQRSHRMYVLHVPIDAP